MKDDEELEIEDIWADRRGKPGVLIEAFFAFVMIPGVLIVLLLALGVHVLRETWRALR